MWSSVLADSTIPKDVDQATGLEKAELDALMAGVEVKHSKTLHNHERSCYYLPYVCVCVCACMCVCAHVCLLGLIVYCLLVDKQQIVKQICGVFQLMALFVCLFVYCLLFSAIRIPSA